MRHAARSAGPPLPANARDACHNGPESHGWPSILIGAGLIWRRSLSRVARLAIARREPQRAPLTVILVAQDWSAGKAGTSRVRTVGGSDGGQLVPDGAGVARPAARRGRRCSAGCQACAEICAAGGITWLLSGPPKCRQDASACGHQAVRVVADAAHWRGVRASTADVIAETGSVVRF